MSDKTYSELVAEKLVGKIVEVHTGDTRHSHQYSDYTINKKSVVRGRLVESFGDVIVVDCILTDDRNKVLEGTVKVYINGWNVLLIAECKQTSTIANIYCDEDARR
jgi:hypothetical protein